MIGKYAKISRNTEITVIDMFTTKKDLMIDSGFDSVHALCLFEFWWNDVGIPSLVKVDNSLL